RLVVALPAHRQHRVQLDGRPQLLDPRGDLFALGAARQLRELALEPHPMFLKALLERVGLRSLPSLNRPLHRPSLAVADRDYWPNGPVVR
ncbi:MAG: hypothetical protein ACI4XG_24720, partial [Bradyrhizobium sp.]